LEKVKNYGKNNVYINFRKNYKKNSN